MPAAILYDVPNHRSRSHPTCGYNHLAPGRCITGEFSLVRRSILIIAEALTKSHRAVFFIKSQAPRYPLASSSHHYLAPPARRLGLILI